MAYTGKRLKERILIFDVISTERLSASTQRKIYGYNNKKGRGTYYYFFISKNNNEEASRNFLEKLKLVNSKVKKGSRISNIIHIDSHGGIDGLYISDEEIKPFITRATLYDLLTDI